ncbi:YlxR family protein [Devosia rhodophyticola]|uniref:YlxR family protein n=1 Tax=Devosia rhodophyticola TaxID=3026423 RepID=A0ABY7Z228_9HYPH|nr:YlxR family protein [Devosia rhodophyticola]WDR07050.1 YlxR family protein [Devosia rhodophyticola]
MARTEETTRLCALSRQEKPVTDLIRFVLGPDGMIVPDTDAKAEGRGVWIRLDKASVAEAVKKRSLAVASNVR